MDDFYFKLLIFFGGFVSGFFGCLGWTICRTFRRLKITYEESTEQMKNKKEGEK